MRISIIAFLIMTVCACQTKTESNTFYQPQKTPLAALKEAYTINLADPGNYSATFYFLRKHKDEVMKTLEVVEEVEVQKDVFLVFYRYSIGTETAKRTEYLRKVDGYYLPYIKYFSSYGDDPFDNGKPAEAKALLEKADNWSENKNLWWAL